jgi:hypothetical protein
MLFSLSTFSGATLINIQNKTKEMSLNDSGYDFQLVPWNDYYNMPGKQGALVCFVINISNTGSLDDTYCMTVSSIEDLVCLIDGKNADQYEPYMVSINSGEWEIVHVTTQIYITPEVPIGEWDIIFEVYSENNTEIKNTLNLKVNIISDFPLELWTSKSEYRPGVVFPIKAKNIGDDDVEFTVSLDIFNQDLIYLVSLYILGIYYLEPGEDEIIAPFTLNEEFEKLLITGKFQIGDEMYVDTLILKLKKSRDLSGNFLMRFLNNFPILANFLNLK